MREAGVRREVKVSVWLVGSVPLVHDLKGQAAAVSSHLLWLLSYTFDSPY